MKRLFIGILMVILMLGCMVPLGMAEDAATPNTDPAADAPAVQKMLITNFEDGSDVITTFADSASKITVSFVTDIVYEGKQAVKVEAQTKNWDGTVYEVPEEKGDWTGMTTFSLWIYGSNSKKGYDIEINDAGNELFIYPLKDNWEGWKQVIIPLNKFKSRSDYQAPKAKVNRKIDYPIKQIQFFNANNNSGSGQIVLYFDLFEVTNE